MSARTAACRTERSGASRAGRIPPALTAAYGAGRVWAWRRLTDLNRGAFSGVEATVYEFLSAPAVREIVSPVLIDAVQGRVPGVVLDVGCGSGGLSEDLRRDGSDVVGADPSVPQLRRLRRRNGFACVAAPAGALPFRDATFAAVVSSCSVKHWPSLSDGLSECVRVLSPGGVLAVIEC